MDCPRVGLKAGPIMINAMRIYHISPESSGYKILVDGMWPRGIKKEDPRIDEWKKNLAPSKELRKWFAHDPDKWEDFRKYYRQELEEKKDILREILELEKQHGEVNLIYSARDEKHNQAVVLKKYLEELKSQ